MVTTHFFQNSKKKKRTSLRRTQWRESQRPPTAVFFTIAAPRKTHDAVQPVTAIRCQPAGVCSNGNNSSAARWQQLRKGEKTRGPRSERSSILFPPLKHSYLRKKDVGGIWRAGGRGAGTGTRRGVGGRQGVVMGEERMHSSSACEGNAWADTTMIVTKCRTAKEWKPGEEPQLLVSPLRTLTTVQTEALLI